MRVVRTPPTPDFLYVEYEGITIRIVTDQDRGGPFIRVSEYTGDGRFTKHEFGETTFRRREP